MSLEEKISSEPQCCSDTQVPSTSFYQGKFSIEVPSTFHQQQKSQFPAIHCWQEKFSCKETSLASPWRDTKKLQFPGTIRKINLGIIFQITVFPITVRNLPKPSHRDFTVTFPDLWLCAIPRAGPSHMPQQGDFPVSLWFLTPWELIIRSRLSMPSLCGQDEASTVFQWCKAAAVGKA